MSSQAPIDRHTPVHTGGPYSPAGLRITPVVGTLIAISVVVAVVTGLGKNFEWVDRLSISEARNGLPEINEGQLWRLITPIFLHFSFLHILFNLMWLKDLGSMIERRSGAVAIMSLVAVIGAISNFGQYWFSGPAFGGMSGVVYGLLGYVWMRARQDPNSGYYLEKQTLILMVLWLVACAANLIPNVANEAHIVGFITGILWGLGDAAKKRGEQVA